MAALIDIATGLLGGNQAANQTLQLGVRVLDTARPRPFTCTRGGSSGSAAAQERVGLGEVVRSGVDITMSTHAVSRKKPTP
eukprot:scaffold2109_cov123-Isochrysis_galbana.AAC.14